jgi:hypothetical protein
MGVKYCPYRAIFLLGISFSTNLLPLWGRKSHHASRQKHAVTTLLIGLR